MAQHHILKCWPGPFAAVLDGSKRFEYRVDDRGYRVGDILHLREYVPGDDGCGGQYSGREVTTMITYILNTGFGLPFGYCVMSLGPATLTTQPVGVGGANG